LTNSLQVVHLFYLRNSMRCLWKFFSWPKRQKSEDEEGQPLKTFDRVTLIQSLESTWVSGVQDARSTSGLQERYVRFGIGSAGNMRKSCFPFLGIHQLSSLLDLPLTDVIWMNRVLSHNGRDIRISSHWMTLAFGIKVIHDKMIDSSQIELQGVAEQIPLT
jgi:hypothetical protein